MGANNNKIPSKSNVSSSSNQSEVRTTQVSVNDGLTVDRKWKVEEEIAEKLSHQGGTSRLIPIAKWIATILLGCAVLTLFISSKISFISLSVSMKVMTPTESVSENNLQEWTEYTGQFLIIYLVLTVPYFILWLRATWMGIWTRKSPWPSKKSIIGCVFVGVLEPLGLVTLSLKVLPRYTPTQGAQFMGTTCLFSILWATYKALRQNQLKVVLIHLLASICALGGTCLVFYQMIYPNLDRHSWLLFVCTLSLNLAWFPWLLRYTTQTKDVVTTTPKGRRRNLTVSASVLGDPELGSTPSSQTSSYSSATGNEPATNVPNSITGVPYPNPPPHSANNSITGVPYPNPPPHSANNQIGSQEISNLYFKKATWKASFVTYSIKILMTFILCFVFFYIDSDFSIRENFSQSMHTAFLDGWNFDSSIADEHTFTAFVVNLVSAAVCYILVFIVFYTNIQRGGFAIPLLLSLPLTIAPIYIQDVCDKIVNFPGFCDAERGELWAVMLTTTLLTLGQFLAFGRLALKKEKIYLLKETELFWIPGYNGAIVESALLLNRHQSIRGEGGQSRKLDKSTKTRVYICTTMYRENEDEMRQLLESVAKINKAQAEGTRFFESHIVFDGGVVNKKLSEFALSLVSLLKDTLEIEPASCTRIITPYGIKLTWGLPAQNKSSAMIFNIHLKDNTLVKNKKRWSQVMYMSHVLDVLTDTAEPDEECYILTTDADVMFSPSSVEALLDLMSRDNTIGAVCARTHPMGSGPLVWYQIFEYAIGHWFQKATEHILGSVLCAPGCFSVYRCRALRDVLPKYCKKVENAFDFLTKDMGEDRWLCTLLVQSGWRIEYCAASEDRTNCPADFEEFYKQRRRWIASTLANLMLIIKEWKYISLFNPRVTVVFLFYQGLLLFSTLIGPSTVILVVSGALVFAWYIDTVTTVIVQVICGVLYALVCIFTAPKTQLLIGKIYTFLYAMIMCAVTVGTIEQIVTDINSPEEKQPRSKNDTTTTTVGPPSQHISIDIPVSVTTLYLAYLVSIFLLAALLHPKEINCLLHGLWYLLCLPSAYLVLIIYSVCNLTDSSWGTREVNATTATVRKESWHAKFKALFYEFFFCCTPPITNKSTGVDAEVQTSTLARRMGSSTAIEEHSVQRESSHLAYPDEFDRQRLCSDRPTKQIEVEGDLDEIDVEEAPLQVDAWLTQEFRAKYAEILKRHGFDSTLFIKAVTEKDLNRMGITNRGHIQSLMSQISMLPAFEIEYKVPTNCKEWLEEIGLVMYLDNFRRNHIRTPKEMEILKRFDRKDIERELGIKKEGHIKRLLYAIRMLRDPSEAQQKAIRIRQTIEKTYLHDLKDVNKAEYDFWNGLKARCLEPDLKAFGIEAEIKEKLLQLRNQWLMILAVSNTLWLILITTLATKGDLTVLGANVLGLIFLFLFGFVFTVQFICMLAHRISTFCHYLARASYKFDKPMLTNWSFNESTTTSLEDSEDILARRQTEDDRKRAEQRVNQGKKRPIGYGTVNERSPLLRLYETRF